MRMRRKCISIQRRPIDADPGPCAPSPDIEGSVPYADSGPGVSGSPAGCGCSEADSRFGVSGGDAGGSRCRASGCAGLIGFPRPEDEAVGQVGGAVGAVAQRPPCGDGACGAGPHADEAGRDDFLKPVQELRECHQRTPQRPAKLGTVSLSLSLSLSWLRASIYKIFLKYQSLTESPFSGISLLSTLLSEPLHAALTNRGRVSSYPSAVYAGAWNNNARIRRRYAFLLTRNNKSYQI